MSLEALLTPTHLRMLAGPGYERGVRYWQQGRVTSRTVGDHGIHGVVQGTSKYEVLLSADRHGLVAQCTCPVGDAGVVCKHAIALAIDHVDGTRAAGQPPATDGSSFATRRQLEAWAAEHHVGHELARSAEVLLAELQRADPSGQLRHYIRGMTIRELGSVEGARILLGGRPVHRAAAEAARQHLARAAADVQIAVAEEAAPRAVPTIEPMAGLWSRLGVLRGKLRKQAHPRSRTTRTNGTLGLDAQRGVLTWTEPTAYCLPNRSWIASIKAELAITPTQSIACACKAAACTHALALVDATMDVLVDPARAELAASFVEELLRPPWQRALAELGKPAAATVGIGDLEVWWHIDAEAGSPDVCAVVKRRRKRGGFSAGARMSGRRLLEDHGAALGEVDLRVAEYLASWMPSRSSTYPARALAALVGHPRVVFDDEPDQPIRVERVPLGFAAMPAGNQLTLEPSLRGARFSPRLLAPLLELHPVGEPLFMLEPEHQRCSLVEVTEHARHLWQVLERHGSTFPPESHNALLERIAALEPRLPISVPDAVKGAQRTYQPITVLRLRLPSDGSLELDVFVRPAPGAPLFPPGAGPQDVLVADGGERGYVRRDLGSEHALVREAIARLPLEAAEEGPPLCLRIDDLDHALALVAAISEPPPGLEAEWVDARPIILSSGGSKALRVQIQAKRNWFGIDGHLKLEQGTIELAVLLDVARRQQRYVRLDDQRWVELSDALRSHLTSIADQTFSGQHGIELSPAAVPTIHALEDAGASVEVAPAWQILVERLASSQALRPRPPASLAKTLRPYQVEGHAWLTRLAAWGAGGCLADDMGLGKTVQTIAVLIDRAQHGPALVLAPTSVVLNWVDELRRFAPKLRSVIYGEQSSRADCIARLGKNDVLIASYGLLARDHAQLAARSFATLVLDEAQALKNPATRRAKAARTLKAEFRVALTGTPLENHLGELWSLFAVVFPNLLGSWDQFRARFAVPIERHDDSRARQSLSRLIRPFLLRRTKREVAKELPARTEIDVPVALSEAETTLYEDARLAAVAQLTGDARRALGEKQRFEVLAALTRLRLLASHPRLYDGASAVASSKMQRLLELVTELRSEGHRALVFSQFTSHLALVRDELARAEIAALYLDGSTPARQRAELIERFQHGDGDVFLISLKAGGTGINLTAADYVIHLDPWWNPAVEDQATDRAHRIGQTRPVTVYRLIARATVEERILALHRDKRALVANVLDGTDVAGRLTTGDLLALLGGGEARGAGRQSVSRKATRSATLRSSS